MAIGQSPFEGQSPFSITDIDPNDLLRAYGDLSPNLFQGMITQGIGPIEIAWNVLTKKKGQRSSEGIETFQDFNNRFGDDQGLTENELTDYTRVVLNGGNPGNVAREIIANTSDEIGKEQLASNKEEKARNFAAAAYERFSELSLMPIEQFRVTYYDLAEQLRISLEQEGLTFDDIKPYLDMNLKEASGKFNGNGAPIGKTVSDDEKQSSTDEFFKMTDAAAKDTDDAVAADADPAVDQEGTGQPPTDTGTYTYSLSDIFHGSNIPDEVIRQYQHNMGLPTIALFSTSDQFRMVAKDKMGLRMSRPGVAERVSAFGDIAFGGYVLDSMMEQEFSGTTPPEELFYQYVDRGFTESYADFYSDKQKETRIKNYAKLIDMGKNQTNQTISSDFTKSDWDVANNDNMVFSAIRAYANITGQGLHGQLAEKTFMRLRERYEQERAFDRTNLGPAAWFSEKVGGPRFTIPKPGSGLGTIDVKFTQEDPPESFSQGAVAAGGPVKQAESPYQTGRTDPPPGWGFPDKDSAYKAPTITLPPQYNEALYRIGDKGFSIQGMGGSIPDNWVAIGFR
jgi:hypothetical protein